MAHPDGGETEPGALLAGLSPQLVAGEFVFCCVAGAAYGDHARLAPLAAFTESEGLTLVLPRESAARAGFSCEQPMRCITLGVHSSLAAVGLTAAVAGALAKRGIAANVLAAYHHDHIFVPSPRAEEALLALGDLAG